MKKKIVIALSWALVLLCMGVIFLLSSRDGVASQGMSDRFTFLLRLPFGSFIVRKGAHFLEFAGLAFLISNALYRSFGNCRPVLAWILTAVYAASDEIHQLFVEGRACRIFDWFVDGLGAATAILVICLVIFIYSKIKRRNLRDG